MSNGTVSKKSGMGSRFKHKDVTFSLSPSPNQPRDQLEREAEEEDSQVGPFMGSFPEKNDLEKLLADSSQSSKAKPDKLDLEKSSQS